MALSEGESMAQIGINGLDMDISAVSFWLKADDVNVPLCTNTIEYNSIL